MQTTLVIGCFLGVLVSSSYLVSISGISIEFRIINQRISLR